MKTWSRIGLLWVVMGASWLGWAYQDKNWIAFGFDSVLLLVGVLLFVGGSE